MNELVTTLIQARLHWREPQANRDHLEAMMRAAGPSNLYVLPETFTTGFLGEAADTDEGMDGATVAWIQGLAAEFDAAITGSAVIATPEGRRNRLLFVAPDGAVQVYDKRHLFSYAGEDRRYVAGMERVVIEYAGWRICPQICYDLRFPVWCRTRGDYDLLLFVANWPSRRVEAWDALLKARAIENQSYVVAVNRVGGDGNDVQYPGHSAIYGPLGEAVIEPWEEEGARTATLALTSVTGTREQLPFAAEADGFRIDP